MDNIKQGLKMKRWLVLVLFLSILSHKSYSLVFRAVVNGDWGSAATWDVAPFDGTGGDGVPGTGDIAITNGFQIGLNPIDGDISVDRLTVSNSVANSVFYNDPFFLFAPVTLTINLSLSSTGAPTVQVIENNSNLNLVIAGTGSAVINNWSTTSPFNNLTFASGGTTTLGSDIAIDNRLTVNASSTLEIGSGSFLTDNSGSAIIEVLSGGTLNVNGALNGDGSTSSRFSTLNINGIVSTGTAGYLNTQSFTLSSTGSLNIGFSGANQTEGWWFDTTAPTGTVSIDASSAISYTANADQTVAATTYGNLNLLSSVSPSSKILQNSNTLSVQGDLTINSANVTFLTTSNSNPIQLDADLINRGTWSPSQLIRFAGTAAQSISGDNAVSFDGGLRIENTMAVVSLLNQGIDVNGTLDIDPSATFNPDVEVVNLFGNLINDGTLVAGTNTGEFIFDGSTDITGSGSHNFNIVTISGTLTAPSATISVASNFTNNGTFNRNSGIVNFNGTSSISGSSTTEFNDLTASGTSVTVNSLVDLYGTLSLTSGTFDADGTGTSSEVLTIKSTAVTGDGRIGELTAPGNFTGNVTVERFIDGRSGGDWRYLSLPIASGNLEFWSDDFPVTGNFSNLPPNGVDNVISNTAASAYFYDANADAWTAIDGGGGATSSVAIVNGTGYSLYVYPDNNTNAIVRGEIAKGPISVPIANVADRFNLVGNPYPSTIDGNQLIDNNTTVGQVFSIRTANTQFASYNAFTNTATTANHPNGSWAGEISTGQSFWVQSNGTGASLDFVEADKADNGAGQFLRTGGEDPTQSVFRVVLESDTQVDETVVIFKEGATPELEFFDGEKFLNGDFRNAINRRTHINLSSYNEAGSDLKYVFNVLSNASCDQSVKLRVEDVAEGSHSLSFIRWNEFKLPYKVTLVDNFVNESVELGEDFVYDFEVTSDAASKGSSRFEIFFESQDVDQDLVLATELVNNCDEQFVSWNLTNVQTGIDYFLLSNDIIVDSIRAENGNAVFYVAKQALSEGVNNFDIRASSPFSCALSDKFYSEAVSIDFEPTPSITSVIGDESCSGSVLQLQAFGAPDGGGYKWYESLESNDPIFVAVNGDFETPSLNQTKIYYVAAFNRQGCEGPREIIQATIAELAAPLTTDALGCRESRLELMVSGSPENGFYRWYNSIDDANPIEGETSDSYVIESLTETTRFYVSSVSPDGCESKRVPIIAEVVELETPEVEVQGLLLVAPEADGYQWYRDGEPIQGANLREYEVNASGLYQVDVSSKGCLSRSNGKIFNITSIDDHLVDLGLSIFPNPLTDYLNIKSLKKGAIEDISFDFYDSNGKQVLSDKHYEKINGDYRIDFSNEKSGTYIMNIKEGERYFSLKILKQ